MFILILKDNYARGFSLLTYKTLVNLTLSYIMFWNDDLCFLFCPLYIELVE